MNFGVSVDRLWTAFNSTDASHRGCIARKDFVDILILHGGQQSAIEVVANQFAASSNPSWVDYVSFLEYLSDIAAESQPLSPMPASRQVTASISPVPRPVAPVRYPLQPITMTSNRVEEKDAARRSENFVDQVLTNVVALRSSSRSSSPETSTARAPPTVSVPPSPAPAVSAPPPRPTAQVSEKGFETCTLAAVFEVLDVDVDGFVTAEDIAIGFSIHGVAVTKLEVDALVESLGIDPKYGRLDKSAFCVLISRMRPPTIQKIRDPSTWNGGVSASPAPQPQTSGPKSRMDAPVVSADTSRIIVDAFHPARIATPPVPTTNSLHHASTASAQRSSSSSTVECRFMKPTASAAARSVRNAPKQEDRPLTATRSQSSAHAPTKASKDSAATPHEAAAPTAPRVRITLPTHFETASTKAVEIPKPSSRSSSVPSNLESLAEAPTPVDRPEAPQSSHASSGHEIISKHFRAGCGQLLALCTKMDKSGSGDLPTQQFRAIMQTVCPTMMHEELDVLVPGKHATASYTEFVAMVIEVITGLGTARSPPKIQEASQRDAKTGDASETLKSLLRDELLSICEGDLQLLLEQFVALDMRRCGYLTSRKLQLALSTAYKSLKTNAPEWVLQRATKIARAPFVGLDGSAESYRVASEAAKRFLRGLPKQKPELDSNSWCDYRFLVDTLRR